MQVSGLRCERSLWTNRNRLDEETLPSMKQQLEVKKACSDEEAVTFLTLTHETNGKV